MGWGLSFSTLLTLFILPALLEIRGDVLTLLNRAWNWRKSAPSQTGRLSEVDHEPQSPGIIETPELAAMAMHNWESSSPDRPPEL